MNGLASILPFPKNAPLPSRDRQAVGHSSRFRANEEADAKMDGVASRRLSSSDKIALAAAFGVAALTFLFGGPWPGFLCLGICVVFLFQWFKQTEPEIESVIPALDYPPTPSTALQTPKITLPNGITIEDYPTEVIDQGWSSTTLVPQAASLLSNL